MKPRAKFVDAEPAKNFSAMRRGPPSATRLSSVDATSRASGAHFFVVDVRREIGTQKPIIGVPPSRNGSHDLE